jgi:hypothetical protein
MKIRMSDDASRPDVLQEELHRTDPDYVTYTPGHWDGTSGDGLNEHFLVFEGPTGDLLTVWTQAPSSDAQQRHGNRLVFARSKDGGESWSDPTHIVGPAPSEDTNSMASWGFPLVSDDGRIYVVYTRHQGTYSWIPMHCGTMGAVYSDDGGRTSSDSQDIPMPESPYDDPAGEVPPEWIVWQKPMRDLNGDWFVGYSHWLHRDVATRAGKKEHWTDIKSVVEFMRFTNVHGEPEPRNMEVQYSGWGKNVL